MTKTPNPINCFDIMRTIKNVMLVAAWLALAFSSAYAQKMPDSLKTKLKEQAAKLYPNDKHESKMWYTNQYYAWQALQAPSSSSADADDMKIIKTYAEKQFPMDFVAQSNYITEKTALLETLAPAKEMLGDDSFKRIKDKALKDSDNDFGKAISIINKQAEAKKALKELSFSDAAKLESLKAEAAKKHGDDYLAQLKEVGAAVGVRTLSDEDRVTVVQAQYSAPAAANKRVESSFERNKRIAKESLDKFLVLTCRNRNAAAGAYISLMDKKSVLVPVDKYEDIAEAELVSNLGKKLDFNRNAIFINKKLPLVLFLIDEYPEGSQEIQIIDESKWKDLLGKQLILVGRLKETLKTYPLMANSLSEDTINIDSRLPHGVGSGSLYINPDDGSVGGMLLSQPIPFKIPEDFTEHGQVSKLIGSMRSSKVAYTMLRLDAVKDNWEKLDMKKLEKQTKDMEQLKLVFADYVDFFNAQTLRSLTQKKYIGRYAKRAFSELNVKRLKQEEHNKRYKSYLNSMRGAIMMELNKIKPEEYYSLYREDAEVYREMFQKMLDSVNNLLKGDFTKFMRQDSTPFLRN